MRVHILTVMVLILFCNAAMGQHQPHPVTIISPSADEEICLDQIQGTAISVSVTNPDTRTRSLRVEFVIQNIVTNIVVYGTDTVVANLAPNSSIVVMLPTYTTSPNMLSQLGSFLADAHVLAVDSALKPIKEWPYTDSAQTRVFGFRSKSLPMNEPFDWYGKARSVNIPNQANWISFGANVVDGDRETWDPPPPRYVTGNGVGPDKLNDPVLRLDRLKANGEFYDGKTSGDTITSHPFNVTGQSKVAFSFDFMRGGSQRYDALWDASRMAGPERTIVDVKGNILRPGDSLIIEFKNPNDPKCNPITWDRIAAIDGGHDIEFQSVWLRVTDSMATLRQTGLSDVEIPLTKHYLDSGFRFRLRLSAHNNAIDANPTDDSDPWYIDNLNLQVPRLPEIELKWARVVVPYSNIPYSEATALPVYFSVRNLGSGVATEFPVQLWVTNASGDTVYSETATVHSLPAGTDTVLRSSDWDAQRATQFPDSDRFILHASISGGYDSYTLDNETQSYFYLKTSQSPGEPEEFGWTDRSTGRNEIPFITGKNDDGIGFEQATGSYAVRFELSHPDTINGARIYFASVNALSDSIRVALYKGDSISCVPGVAIIQNGSPVTLEDVRRVQMLDRFTTYYFQNPVVLPAGTYWCSVSQLSENNYMIGGSLSRGGGMIAVGDSIVPVIEPAYHSRYGTQWSATENAGEIGCAFAVETMAGSGNWTPLMPSEGWWPAHRLGQYHQAVSFEPKLLAPFTQAGSFIPMIRVMVGSHPLSHSTQSVGNFANRISIERVIPNPFTPSTTLVGLHYTLPMRGYATISMFDVLGRCIRSFRGTNKEPGSHIAHWDGSDSDGNRVPPGIYIVRLEESGMTASAKIIVAE